MLYSIASASIVLPRSQNIHYSTATDLTFVSRSSRSFLSILEGVNETEIWWELITSRKHSSNFPSRGEGSGSGLAVIGTKCLIQ